MIPAQHTSYVARYKQENSGHPHFSCRPVVAWHDGVAQVVDGRTGRLVDADTFSNFANVQPEDLAPVVAAVPGGGWLAEHRAEDETTYTMTVVTWNVRADGTLDPVTVSSDGIASDPTEEHDFVRLYLPSEEPTPGVLPAS
ncbi:hypothetical protein ABZU94_29855 [Streptomyces mirabilis]|uniref:hypothetical protein n=1 Tax=Streptomyces sp. NPDC005388 TaxID=3156717 RepID=UPI00339DF350